VEIVAQGDAEAVRALVEWSHLGPVRAEVTSVDIGWEETQPIDGFSIR
jgi:acylphosphatase